MRKPLAAGNWKMHKTLAEARALVSALRAGLEARPGISGRVDVAIFPPATLLFPIAKAVDGSPIVFGAQNAHFEAQGAFTGEVSVPMVKETGAATVLVGHSERRHVFGESADILTRKVAAVLGAGLTCVYCVGETLDEREAGRTERVVGDQLDAALGGGMDLVRVVIAYEPVWAIGTGRTATPQTAQQAHAFIRARLSEMYGQSAAAATRILYGGSVKPGNAAELMAGPDVDGVLVGGACLVADDFLAIIDAVAAG
ncbi:MAG: triose-phosphate isomerase [Phycisphaerales bacterium]|nr:MAG: triose-phosphate isomerase [Phycisphaerales bacterium]